MDTDNKVVQAGVGWAGLVEGKWGRGMGDIFNTVNNKKNLKDTWTRPRGRVEAKKGGGFGWGGGEWWGENTDNCN